MKKFISIMMILCLMLNIIYPVKAASTDFMYNGVDITSAGYYKAEGNTITTSDENDYNLKTEMQGDTLNITLYNFDIADSSISFSTYYGDETVVNLYYEGDCSLTSVFAANDLTISGNGSLKIDSIYGKGQNDDKVTIAQGSKVSVGYLSIGASGGVDGMLYVNGKLDLNSGFFGGVEVGTTGLLNIYEGITLNGKTGSVQDYTETFKVNAGGVVNAYCESQAIVVDGGYEEYSGGAKNQVSDVFVLPKNYLPEDLQLYKGSNGGYLFFTLMENEKIESGKTLEKEDSAGTFTLAQRYEIKTVDCTSDKKLVLPNEIITLTANEPAQSKMFDKFETSVDGVVVNEDGTFAMPASDITVSALYKDILINELTLNKDKLNFNSKEASEQLIATYKPSNALNTDLVWSSSDESVATVDQNGKVTAINDGKAIITVKNEASNKSASCEVNVTIEYKINAINCNVMRDKAIAGEEIYLTYNLIEGYEFTGYTFSVEGIEMYNTFYFKMPASDLTITANYEEVIEKSIELDKENLAFNEKDQEEKITATIKPEGLGDEVFYKSTNVDVAIVDENGVVRPVAEGMCKIIASNEDGSLEAVCEVIVDFKEEVEGQPGGESQDKPVQQPSEESQDKPAQQPSEESQDKPEEKPVTDNNQSVEKPTDPQTSDSSNIGFYMLLLVASAMVLVITKKKAKE